MAVRRISQSALEKEIRNIIKREYSGGPSKNLEDALDKSKSIKMNKDSYKAKGKTAAGCIFALGLTGGNRSEACRHSRKRFGDGHPITKALQSSDFESGGALLPVETSNEIIELLRPMSAVRRMDPPVQTLDANRVELPKTLESGSATWIGESTPIPKSQQKTGQIVLSPKKLAALVPLSNDMTKNGGDSVLEFVRRDLIQEIGREEDVAFLTSDGTASRPTGLRHLAKSDNVSSSNGTSSANVEKDLKELIEDLRDNHVPMSRPRWVMSSRSFLALTTLRDAAGFLTFQGLREQSTEDQASIFGFPIIVSNNVPNDLGAGSDESLVFLVDADQLVLGQGPQLQVQVSDTASYTENGSLVSSFERDESTIRVLTHVDLQTRHDSAIAVKTGIKWT
jgi:HK97 family phage major capsid protein